MADDLPTTVLIDLAGQIFTVGLKSRNDIELLTLAGPCANGSAVNHQRWTIQPAHRDQTARHVFVASGNGNIGVVPLTAHGGLNGIGDEISRLQREAHSVGAHSDAVANTD